MIHATVHSIDLVNSVTNAAVVFAFKGFYSIQWSTNHFLSLAPYFCDEEWNKNTYIPLYTLNAYELHSYQVEYRVHSVNVIRWIKSECVFLLLLNADVSSFIHVWFCMIVFEPFRCFHYFLLLSKRVWEVNECSPAPT